MAMDEVATDAVFARSSQWIVNQVYRTLQATKALLTDLDVPYTMLGGTLLGAMRHSGFIPWDDDGDVAILADDERKLEQCSRVLRPGFDIAFSEWGSYKIYPVDGRQIPGGLPFRFPFVDIFPLVESPDGRLVYKYELARRTWPTHFFRTTDFASREAYSFGPLRLCGVPRCAASAYLSRAYGENWRTEAYLTFDHEEYHDREKRVVRLEDFSCRLPSPGSLSA